MSFEQQKNLLYEAAKRGAPRHELSHLMDLCGDLNAVFKCRDFCNKLNLIHVAVTFHNNTLLDLLLERNVGVDNVVSESKHKTPLWFAIHMQHFDQTLTLLHAGANIRKIGSFDQIIYGVSAFGPHFLQMAALVFTAYDQNDRVPPILFFKGNYKKSGEILLRMMLLNDMKMSYIGDDPDIKEILAVPRFEMPRVFQTEHRMLVKMRFALYILPRAFQVCVALQSLEIDANCLSEIVMAACEPIARELPFYSIWDFVTKVKHFQDAK